MNLRPLNNTIMFKFLDSTSGSKGTFTDMHVSGIIILPSNDKQKVHRWAEAVFVGPKVDGIVPGDFILIESLMWMEGSEVGGQKLWKTDDSKVLAVTNDRATCQSQAL